MTKTRLAGRRAALAMALTLAGSTALALDVQIPAKILLQKPGKKTKIVAKGSFPLPDPNADDPAVEGGSIKFSSSVNPTGTTFTLDPGTWSLLGKPEAPKGYKSKNGGCKIVLLKPTVVKALCPPVDLGPLPIDPDTAVRTVLSVGAGTTRYCAECGGEAKGNPEKLTKRKECPAPAAGSCPGGALVCTGAEICGDGCIEGGETCDDGNTVDGDSCPSSCVIESCQNVNPASRSVTVRFTGSGVAGITVLLDYPEGRIALPFTGPPPDQSTFDAYFGNVPTGASLAPNDLDYALIGVVARDTAFASGAIIFRVFFDDCQGQSPPAAGEIPCTVLDASDTDGQPVAGVTCSVTVP